MDLLMGRCPREDPGTSHEAARHPVPVRSGHDGPPQRRAGQYRRKPLHAQAFGPGPRSGRPVPVQGPETGPLDRVSAASRTPVGPEGRQGPLNPEGGVPDGPNRPANQVLRSNPNDTWVRRPSIPAFHSTASGVRPGHRRGIADPLGFRKVRGMRLIAPHGADGRATEIYPRTAFRAWGTRHFGERTAFRVRPGRATGEVRSPARRGP